MTVSEAEPPAWLVVALAILLVCLAFSTPFLLIGY